MSEDDQLFSYRLKLNLLTTAIQEAQWVLDKSILTQAEKSKHLANLNTLKLNKEKLKAEFTVQKVARITKQTESLNLECAKLEVFVPQKPPISLTQISNEHIKKYKKHRTRLRLKKRLDKHSLSKNYFK